MNFASIFIASWPCLPSLPPFYHGVPLKLGCPDLSFKPPIVSTISFKEWIEQLYNMVSIASALKLAFTSLLRINLLYTVFCVFYKRFFTSLQYYLNRCFHHYWPSLHPTPLGIMKALQLATPYRWLLQNPWVPSNSFTDILKKKGVFLFF